MGELKEYVDGRSERTCQERLYSYLRRPPENNSIEDHAEWERRSEAFEAYLKSNVRTANPTYGEKGYIERLLNYDSLSDILRIWNLNGKKALEIMGVEMDWPSQDFQTVAGLCDELDGQAAERIKLSAFALASDWWQKPEIRKAQPSDRAKALFRSKGQYSQQKNAPKMLLRAIDDRRGTTSIPIFAFNEIAAYLQVSPHWLLRFAPDVALFGSQAATDVILDAFSFMPGEAKQLFIEVLNTYVKGGGTDA